MEFFQSMGTGMRLFLGFVFIIFVLPWAYARFYTKFHELPLTWPKYRARLGRIAGPLEKVLGHRPRMRGHRRPDRKPLVGNREALAEKYRPVEEHMHNAIIMWAVAILCGLMAIIAYALTRDWRWAMAGMLCVGPAFVGFAYQESADRRRQALGIEEEERSNLIRKLPSDWKVMQRQTLENGENVDLQVTTPDEEMIIVEIKSWKRWAGSRKERALRAVDYQKKTVNAARALIWLPRALTPEKKMAGDIQIISGPAEDLINAMQGAAPEF